MKTLRPILFIVAVFAGLCSCQPVENKTLTLYSEAALDGMVVDEGALVYSGSYAGASVSIGDNTADATIRCLVSFNLASLPAGAQVVSATLRMYQDANYLGDSYTEQGSVLVDNVTYTALTTWDELFNSVPTGTDIGIGPLATSYSADTWHQLDVTNSLAFELSTYHNGRLQFRIYHNLQEIGSDDDTDGWTMGDSATNKPELVIEYK